MTVRKKLIPTPIGDDWVTCSNYKEPLLPIKEGDGYGYYGVLLITPDLEKVQCHLCGRLFKALPLHLVNEHDITARNYKVKFALQQKTGLLSEMERSKRAQAYFDYRERIGPEAVDKMRENARKQAVIASRGAYLKNGMRGHSLEYKNLHGTCPDQILDQITILAKELGHTPSQREFFKHSSRYEALMRLTFGTWLNALKVLGMKPKERVYVKGYKMTNYRRYTKEDLLERLRMFYKTNGRLPMFSDFQSDLLPSYKTYCSRFGGIENARKEAGL